MNNQSFKMILYCHNKKNLELVKGNLTCDRQWKMIVIVMYWAERFRRMLLVVFWSCFFWTSIESVSHRSLKIVFYKTKADAEPSFSFSWTYSLGLFNNFYLFTKHSRDFVYIFQNGFDKIIKR
jgi:hypothetical protein